MLLKRQKNNCLLFSTTALLGGFFVCLLYTNHSPDVLHGANTKDDDSIKPHQRYPMNYKGDKSHYHQQHTKHVVATEPNASRQEDSMFPVTFIEGRSSYLNFYNIFNTSMAHLCQGKSWKRDNRFNSEKLCAKARNAVEDTFRKGDGLKPYTTDMGEKAWIENGIVYRPFRKPKHRVIYEKHFEAEFEMHIPFDKELFFQGRNRAVPKPNEYKTILWWKNGRHMPSLPEPRKLRSCPDFPCLVTTNRNYTNVSSALVFFVQDVNEKPPARSPGQVFVLHHNEPTGRSNMGYKWGNRNVLIDPDWRSVFNWTMTPRQDSDFHAFYGLVRKRRVPVSKDYSKLMTKKTKKVAWVASNCMKGREIMKREYVDELKKYIEVDVFGSCGKHRCPRKENERCLREFGSNYKFILGFESNLCIDYKSEKFFQHLNYDAITVYRGIDTSYLSAPSEIFINTENFASPKALANYLHYLDSHDEEYLKIWKEKDKYMAIFEDYVIVKNKEISFLQYGVESAGTCKMCHWLWNLENHRKSVPDVLSWWREAPCRAAQDVNGW